MIFIVCYQRSLWLTFCQSSNQLNDSCFHLWHTRLHHLIGHQCRSYWSICWFMECTKPAARPNQITDHPPKAQTAKCRLCTVVLNTFLPRCSQLSSHLLSAVRTEFPQGWTELTEARYVFERWPCKIVGILQGREGEARIISAKRSNMEMIICIVADVG